MLKNNFGRSLILVFFIIITFLILAELILRLLGFIYVLNQDRLNKKSLQNNPDYTILALGESTTDMGGETSWPKQLEKILNEKIDSVKFSVINKGRSGTNSYKILSELEKNLNTYKPDIVITMMGINDGVTPDLKVYDQSFAVTIDNPSQENNALNFLSQLRVYKFFKVLKVIIVKEIQKIFSITASAAENSERLEKLLLENPGDYILHTNLGDVYMSQNRSHDAAIEYQKALDINPHNYLAYIGLANHYKNQAEDTEAEKMYKRAIEIEPKGNLGYMKLGIHLRDMGRYEESVSSFMKIIELDSQTGEEVYRQLAMSYRYAGMFKEAEEVLKKMLVFNPSSKVANYELENLYRQIGEKNKANEISGKVLGVNSVAANNYRRLKEIVLARQLKLVAVQYPTRNIESLKDIIGKDNVVFVDNEKIFLDTLKAGRYEDYFIDRFAGDFGHATPKGNFLIASNIANVIIEKVLKEEFTLKVK